MSDKTFFNFSIIPCRKVRFSLGLTSNPPRAYLIEARSIGGLSGSPVFVHTSGLRTVGGQATISTGNQFYWLGVMHGHWDLPNPTEDAVNMGIAIVVPAEKVVEIINQPHFSHLT